MFELFVGAMRAAMAARVVWVAYWPGQATRLAPVMRKLRQGTVSAALVIVAATLACASPGEARSRPATEAAGSSDPAPGSVSAAAHEGISLDEAVSRAERQYHARVVRTDVQDEDGRKVYVLKLLSEDGRVFTVRIDAATGRMR
jgi:uncharacterized membrane protein YkoI